MIERISFPINEEIVKLKNDMVWNEEKTKLMREFEDKYGCLAIENGIVTEGFVKYNNWKYKTIKTSFILPIIRKFISKYIKEHKYISRKSVLIDFIVEQAKNDESCIHQTWYKEYYNEEEFNIVKSTIYKELYDMWKNGELERWNTFVYVRR
ncbi:MAG: hypothetical protein ACFFDF_03970 [Candidatus Odinarchaeota archaeon]